MKVLFYAYSFPPASFPGSVRTWNMARALTGNGSSVSVVTLSPAAWRRSEGTSGSAPGLRRIEADAPLAFLIPWDRKTSDGPLRSLAAGVARRALRSAGLDPYIGWKIGAARATASLTARDADVVLASGGPFVSFELARRTAARLGKPFVVDYRDLWNHNPHGHLNEGMERREAAILREATAVLAVSPSILAVLDEAYGIGPKGHVLGNGFDEEELSAVQPAHFDHFAVLYTGQFYPPKRVPGPLLEALRAIDVPGWKFHYAGPTPDAVAEAAAALGIAERVVMHGNVSRRESLSLAAGAPLSAVITSVQAEADAADRGIVTSKIFEIIGLRRPMLVIAPPGSDVETMVAGRSQTACIPAAETRAMASFVERIAANGAPATAMPELSWRRLGAEVERILREVAGR